VPLLQYVATLLDPAGAISRASRGANHGPRPSALGCEINCWNRRADGVPADKRAVAQDIAIRDAAAMQAVAAVTITYTQTTYTVTQTRAVTAPVATTTENGEPILWRLNGRGGC